MFAGLAAKALPGRHTVPATRITTPAFSDGCESEGAGARTGGERRVAGGPRSTTGGDTVAARRRQRRHVSISFRALGTSVVIATVDPMLEGDACAVATAELNAIDHACSRFRADSELSRVNHARGKRVAVGALLLEALNVALDAARKSGGLVDPTVGTTLRTLGYDSTFRVVAMRDGDSFHASFSDCSRMAVRRARS